MIKRLFKGFAWAKRLEDERGEVLVELAMCATLLIILAFGTIEFSQMLLVHQTMAGLTRQGSSLASRGTTLPDTMSALVAQGASLNIATNGRIFVTEVADINNAPQIINQVESPSGIAAASAVGTGIGNPATMPSSARSILQAGQAIYVTEVFYTYSPMTPVGSFLNKSLASTFYEAAYF